ncbi:MAG: hypothetical protein AAGF90_03200, partial [Pseudomonadota bacterium]
AAELLPAEAPAPVLKQAAFRAITDRRVDARLAPPAAPPGPDDAGEAVFDAGGEALTVVFTAQGEEAPRGDRPERCRYSLIECSAKGPLDAEYAVEGVETLEDALVAVVQTVKKRHEALADDVRDVWFTGLRGGTLPARGAPAAASGRLAIKGGRIMGRAPAWQTMQRVEMTDNDGAAVFSAMVNFAFKSDRFEPGAA